MIIPNNNPNLYALAVENADLWRREAENDDASLADLERALGGLDDLLADLLDLGAESEDFAMWPVIGWNISSSERTPICAGASAEDVENSFYMILDTEAGALNGKSYGDPKGHFLSTLAPVLMRVWIGYTKSRIAELEAEEIAEAEAA